MELPSYHQYSQTKIRCCEYVVYGFVQQPTKNNCDNAIGDVKKIKTSITHRSEFTFEYMNPIPKNERVIFRSSQSYIVRHLIKESYYAQPGKNYTSFWFR